MTSTPLRSQCSLMSMGLMSQDPSIATIAWLTASAVAVGWALWALAFLLRPRVPKAAEVRQDAGSRIGIAVQAIGFAAVWMIRRPLGTPILPAGRFGALLIFAVAALLALSGAWLAFAAVQALGRHWSVTARVVESHVLVTSGPYAVIRHPIYTSMLAMLLATGLAISHWIGLLAGATILLVGTLLRIRVEDRLLRQTLGTPFELYAGRVPALIPWPRKWSASGRPQ